MLCKWKSIVKVTDKHIKKAILTVSDTILGVEVPARLFSFFKLAT